MSFHPRDVIKGESHLVRFSSRVLCEHKQSSSTHNLRVLGLLIRHQILLGVNYGFDLFGLVLCPDHFDVLLQPELELQIVLVLISIDRHSLQLADTHLSLL